MKTQKKFTEIKIKEIMSTRVHTLMTNDTIHDAVAMMLDNGLTTIPIVDSENKCIGILSRSDMNELFLEEDSELAHTSETPRLSLAWINQSLETCDTRLVKELMTYEVATIGESQCLTDASQEMVRQRIHHLPVINDREQITGIVSAFDIVKAVAEV
jgi:CBS-domain-containing membrane protein